MINNKLPQIFYGGDFSPEQWDKDIWQEDIRLMKKAGVNLVTIAVFSWAQLQPNESTYTFEWLDEVMKLLEDNGIYADLGTATAAPPAWMSKKYPEILPVTPEGRRMNYGSRQTFCPNNEIYKRMCNQLVSRLAERYKNNKALAMWHVNNEYSQFGMCYCDTCANKFREWLFKIYGSLNELNKAWGTGFWGQIYFEWDEVIPPRETAHQINPSLLIDYKRFMNDSYLECYLGESSILREISPNVPITTNFLYEYKHMDYFKWAPHIDFISVSSFPDPKPGQTPAEAAISHDIMRGLKNGKPFVLLEQAPSNVNWRMGNVNKRPGVMGLWSYQGLAHGADGVMFFQWRQSLKGSEKFHSAIVSHYGENSRVYKEAEKLGNELICLNELIDSKVKAEVAIILDYNNWWAVEYIPAPSMYIKYLEQLQKYYYPLYDMNISVDIVPFDGDLSEYKLVIAPLLYMIKPGFKENIEKYVENGGSFLTTFFSGVADETDGVFVGGYPGPLKNVLGVEVEEYDALKPYMNNTIKVQNKIEMLKDEYKCNLWCDLINTTTAKPLAVYGEDYYTGRPCVTENSFGKGKAYYVATQPETGFTKAFLNHLCQINEIRAPFDVPEGIELTKRFKDDKEYIFILNHNEKDSKIKLPEGKYRELVSKNIYEYQFELVSKGTAILSKI